MSDSKLQIQNVPPRVASWARRLAVVAKCRLYADDETADYFLGLGPRPPEIQLVLEGSDEDRQVVMAVQEKAGHEPFVDRDGYIHMTLDNVGPVRLWEVATVASLLEQFAGDLGYRLLELNTGSVFYADQATPTGGPAVEPAVEEEDESPIRKHAALFKGGNPPGEGCALFDLPIDVTSDAIRDAALAALRKTGHTPGPTASMSVSGREYNYDAAVVDGVAWPVAWGAMRNCLAVFGGTPLGTPVVTFDWSGQGTLLDAALTALKKAGATPGREPVVYCNGARFTYGSRTVNGNCVPTCWPVSTEYQVETLTNVKIQSDGTETDGQLYQMAQDAYTKHRGKPWSLPQFFLYDPAGKRRVVYKA